MIWIMITLIIGIMCSFFVACYLVLWGITDSRNLTNKIIVLELSYLVNRKKYKSEFKQLTIHPVKYLGFSDNFFIWCSLLKDKQDITESFDELLLSKNNLVIKKVFGG